MLCGFSGLPCIEIRDVVSKTPEQREIWTNYGKIGTGEAGLGDERCCAHRVGGDGRTQGDDGDGNKGGEVRRSMGTMGMRSS